MGLIDDLFSSNSYDASAAKAKAANEKFANQGFDKASGYVTKYGKKAVGALADPLEKINDIYEQEQLGRIAYMNALGLQGPENSEAARAMFQASPGYQYQLEQGAETGLRNRALAGSTRSGGAMTDLNAYAQNLANQDWGNWLNRLQMFNPLAANAQNAGLSTTKAGIYGNMASQLLNANTSKYDALRTGAVGYENALAQNRAGAAGNVFDLFKVGANLAGQAAGAAFGGMGGGGAGPMDSLGRPLLAANDPYAYTG